MLKIAIIAALVGGAGIYVKQKYGSVPNPQTLVSQLKSQATSIDVNTLGKNLSSSLDSLVTNTDKNSPVVLGVKIGNDSLSVIVDVIQKLPPDQINQVKTIICAPSTSQ